MNDCVTAGDAMLAPSRKRECCLVPRAADDTFVGQQGTFPLASPAILADRAVVANAACSRPFRAQHGLGGFLVPRFDEVQMTDAAWGNGGDDLPARRRREAEAQRQSVAEGADLARRQRLATDHQVVQPAGAGQAGFEAGGQHVARLAQPAAGMLRNSRKRFGEIPAQALKVRCKCVGLSRTCSAMRASDACRRAWLRTKRMASATVA